MPTKMPLKDTITEKFAAAKKMPVIAAATAFLPGLVGGGFGPVIAYRLGEMGLITHTGSDVIAITTTLSGMFLGMVHSRDAVNGGVDALLHVNRHNPDIFSRQQLNRAIEDYAERVSNYVLVPVAGMGAGMLAQAGTVAGIAAAFALTAAACINGRKHLENPELLEEVRNAVPAVRFTPSASLPGIQP